MMKKLLSLIVTATMLSSIPAYAAGFSDGGSGGVVTDYISSLSVSQATVNPAQNGSATVGITMVNTASLFVYVLDSNYDTVATLKSNGITTPGTYSYVWYGTVGNVSAGASALANGSYTIRAFAYDTVNGNVVDYAYSIVSVANEAVVPPSTTNVDVSALSVSPSTITAGSQSATISFSLNTSAFIDVEVKSGTNLIREFSAYNGSTTYSAGNYSLVWDGKNNLGDLVANGGYTVSVRAFNAATSDTELATVNVTRTVVVENDLIKNFKLYPSTQWDPSEDDELEIDFDLMDDVDSLRILAKKGSNTIEIYEEDDAQEDDYSETWDGTDEDGDEVEVGTWEIIVVADSERVSKFIEIVREVPEITEAFVTKTSIDNEIGEVTNLVFKVNTSAVVTVELYKGSKRLEKLLEEEDVSKNRWYSVEWDGTDDGDEVSEGTYELKITAENSNDDNVSSSKTVSVTVKEDTSVRNSANVTNDFTNPIVFETKSDEYLSLNYCMDDDAEIFLAIYKGLSASGSVQVELLDYVSQKKGCHEVKWNLQDDNGKLLKDNVYSYKLISKTSDGKKDTETGRFVVGKMSSVTTPDNNNDDKEDPKPVSCGNSYYDVTNVSPQMCEAITWATNAGIFAGYSDGSFRPYQNINRAETLKVVFEAFRSKVTMLPSNGSTLGFKDVNPDGWYMTYARTAKFYGMLHGYVKETEARFSNDINRVEFLKFALEACDAFTAWEIPGHETTRYADVKKAFPNNVWYFDYAGVADTYGLYNTYYDLESGETYLRPSQLVQRGEVALLLYRMYLNGLTQ